MLDKKFTRIIWRKVTACVVNRRYISSNILEKELDHVASSREDAAILCPSSPKDASLTEKHAAKRLASPENSKKNKRDK